MIRLLVADDHSLVRRGIVNLISESPNMMVVGEASSGSEVLDRAAGGGFDIIILDIAFPDKSGLDILRELKLMDSEIKVIMLSMYDEDRFAVRSLMEGASAYISKRSADSELVAAIRAVASGKRYTNERVAENLARFVARKSRLEPHEMLAGREFQVLLLLGSGLSVQDAALRLGINRKTVSTYRRRVFDKMGFSRNAQAVEYCIEHHLLFADTMNPPSKGSCSPQDY
jgi:DNA-binding NarL/FixJ family response regulator